MSQERDSELQERSINNEQEEQISNHISGAGERSRNEEPIQIHSRSLCEIGGIAQNEQQEDEKSQNDPNQLQDKKDKLLEEEKGEDEEELAQLNEEDLRRENEEAGKNVRKNSSDSIRESRENDTSQLQTGGGKKCFNKQCPSKKIFKKIRSKVEPNKYRFLCKSCYENYSNNFFCQFCEQIYSNNQDHDEEDMNRWVGCDTCDRWNHIECQRKNRNKLFDIEKQAKYQCLVCARKSKSVINPGDELPKKKVQRDYQGINVARNQRMKIEINKEDRVPIFHKKPDTYPNLEPFLQGYNFRLWLTEAMIRDDIDLLRTTMRRPPIEDEPKKTKKIKQD